MDEERVVHCAIHGPHRAAFVCRHLIHGTVLGFITPDAPGDELQGWCGDCEQVRVRCGGWDDESETVAQITLICDLCYAAARDRNRVPESPPNQAVQKASPRGSLLTWLRSLMRRFY